MKGAEGRGAGTESGGRRDDEMEKSIRVKKDDDGGGNGGDADINTIELPSSSKYPDEREGKMEKPIDNDDRVSWTVMCFGWKNWKNASSRDLHC